MADPLHDLERRVDSLAAKVDLNDATIRADIVAMRADITALRAEAVTDAASFVTLARFIPLERLFWAQITAVIVGLVGAVVAITTRSP